MVIQRRAELPVPISVMVTTVLLVYCTLFRVNEIPVAHDKHTNCNLYITDVVDANTTKLLWLCKAQESEIIALYIHAKHFHML